MADGFEIYHRPARGGSLQRLIARCSNTEEYLPIQIVAQVRGPTRNLEMSQMGTSSQIPFKCHTTETIPISLFQQCISYVAYFAQYIDSLDGFPVDVANMVFIRCIALNKLDSKSNMQERQTILAKFCHAFGQEVLHSCKITNLVVLNNFEEEFVLLMRGISKLDLSNCYLGDNHDFLRSLIDSAPRLEMLILSGNNLSNRGLSLLKGHFRDLLLPRHRPLSRLQYLDISQNPGINMLGISKYVVPFESIKRIVITNVESNPGESLLENFQPTETFHSEVISNEGWMGPVIESWVRFIQDQSRARTQVPKNLSFYGKKKVPSMATMSKSVDGPPAIKVLLERRENISFVAKRPRLERQSDEDNEFDLVFSLYRS